MPGKVVRMALAIILAGVLAAFFGFVGWHKAVDPVADLARYHAWTVYLPEAAGRLVGVSEIACAAALLATLMQRWRQLAMWAALVLVGNQTVAAAVHALHGEPQALPQNAVLIAMLLALASLLRGLREKT